MKERDLYYRVNDKQEGPVAESRLRQMLESHILPADTMIWSEDNKAWLTTADFLNKGDGGWYYDCNNQQQGPVSESEIQSMLSSRSLPGSTLVWSKALRDWTPATDVPQFKSCVPLDAPPPLPRQATPPPQRTGTSRSVQPRTPLRTQAADRDQVSPDTQELHPWHRYWARAIDMSIYAIPAAIVTFVIKSIVGSQLGEFFVNYAAQLWFILYYLCLFLSWFILEGLFLSSFGTTPGKALYKIKVHNSQGENISFGQGLGRSLTIFVRAAYILYIFQFAVAKKPMPLLSDPTMMLACATALLIFGVTLYQYGQYVKNGSTSWDRDQGIVVTHAHVSSSRYFLIIVLLLILNGISGWLSQMAFAS